MENEIQAAVSRMQSVDLRYMPVYPGGQKQFDLDCQVLAVGYLKVLEMLSGTTVQDGEQRLWTIRTPLAPDSIYRNHMTEFTASVAVAVGKRT